MLKTQVRQQNPILTLYMQPAVEMTDEVFFHFCQLNRELRIERSAEGDLEIMSPTGGETSARNMNLAATLGIWAQKDGTGVAFDSSGGFILPSRAVRSPDAAWVRRARLATLTPEEKKRFIPLCPDFVLELRSPTDSLAALQAKMGEYIDNGARLGWLLDAENRQVYVYRPGVPVESLEHPSQLSGDPELPGFVLNLEEIWEVGF